MSPKSTQAIALLNIARELVGKPPLDAALAAEVVRKLEGKGQS